MSDDLELQELRQRVLQLEIQLAASEQRVRGVLDQTFQFIGVLSPDGTVRDVNRSALQFIGLAAEDVAGKPFWETPWWTHSARAQDELRDAIRRAADGEFVRFETTHVGVDGEQATIEFSLKPVADAQGQVAFLVPEGRDISERKRMEESLRRSQTELEDRVTRRTEELLRANAELQAALAETQRAEQFRDRIIDAVADPVFVKDEKHRWVALNDAMCRFVGVSKDRLLQKSDFDFFPPAEAQVFWEVDDLVFRTGKDNVNEEVLTDASGCSHVISTKKTLFVDESGQRFLVGVIRDLTEVRRTQQLARSTSWSRCPYRWLSGPRAKPSCWA